MMRKYYFTLAKQTRVIVQSNPRFNMGKFAKKGFAMAIVYFDMLKTAINFTRLVKVI